MENNRFLVGTKAASVLLLILVLSYFYAGAQELPTAKAGQIKVSIHRGFHGTRQYTLPEGATILNAVSAIDEKIRNELTLHHVRLSRIGSDGHQTTPTRIDLDEQRKDPSKATVLQTGDTLDFQASSLSPIF